MYETASQPRAFGSAPRGISQSDVSHAADSLLRAGERPTIEKVRAKIGRGSPNTINPMLDAWWKTLSARLDSGPASLHRLPEVVAHVAEALWLQALEEARRRARAELKADTRVNADNEQALAVRSHVLSLREGELDSRLRDRDRTIEELNLRLREITGALRKEQATREWLSRQTTNLPSTRLKKRKMSKAARLPKSAKVSKTVSSHRNPAAKTPGTKTRSRNQKRRRRG